MHVVQEIQKGTARQTTVSSSLSPTRQEERIASVDMLRGFALFGVLVVNFSSPTMSGFTYTGHHGVDYATFWIIDNFFQHKFYPLFSFLFGAGMALQMARAQQRQVKFPVVYARRLAILFVIGIVHSFFVWSGDVLRLYSMLGFLLLLFRKSSSTTILIVAASLVAISTLHQPIAQALSLSEPGPSGLVGPEAYRLYTSPDYGMLVAARVMNFIRELTHVKILLQFVDVLGMFLFGLYVGRKGILQDLSGNMRFIRNVFFGAFALAFLGEGWALAHNHLQNNPWVAPIANNQVAGYMTHLFYEPAVSMCYACVFVLLLQNNIVYTVLLRIASVGRMSLSNYLTYSIIGMMLFYSAGLGLYGKLGYATGTAIAICIYIAQISVCVWWLRRYRFGPMEWIWRSLTYGQFQPMRVRKIA